MADSLSADDRFELTELLVRYARALDAHDADAYAANFAKDGVFRTSRGDTYTGREDIRAGVDKIMADWSRPVRHHGSPPLIEGDAAMCSVRSYTQVLVEVPDGPCLISSVVEYHDVCIKEGGHWVFAERQIHQALNGHMRP